MGGLSCPLHKKIHSLWNRHLACSLFRSNPVKHRCYTILNKAFMGGLSCPPHKKIHSLWNRHLACSLFRSNPVKQRCCTILNKAFMGGLSCPPHKKIHSLWNRHLACSLEWCRYVSLTSHSGTILNKTVSTGFLDQNLGTCS
jgi:hypothetical protein